MKLVINSWALKESITILNKINNKCPNKGYVLFETGYGPSGFPHFGTLSEIIKTYIIEKSFNFISNIPTKLLSISDDMDAFLNIDYFNLLNIHNNLFFNNITISLFQIPSLIYIGKSYSQYMNIQLIKLFTYFKIKFYFLNTSFYYTSGKFNYMIVKILEKYENITNFILDL